MERRLRELLDIPVFHDDQHGTAIVVLAALTNALRVVGKELGDVRITLAGAGAAGTAVLRLLFAAGARNVIVCDYLGAVHRGRDDLDDSLRWIADHTNAEGYSGDLRGAVKGADVFIGVSAPGILNGDDIATMAKDAVVFALANPEPEVSPDAAREHAAVVATGRSDYPNQINNVLAFPGRLPRPARRPGHRGQPGDASGRRQGAGRRGHRGGARPELHRPQRVPPGRVGRRRGGGPGVGGRARPA